MELQHNGPTTEQPPRPEDRYRDGLAMLVCMSSRFVLSASHKLTSTLNSQYRIWRLDCAQHDTHRRPKHVRQDHRENTEPDAGTHSP